MVAPEAVSKTSIKAFLQKLTLELQFIERVYTDASVLWWHSLY